MLVEANVADTNYDAEKDRTRITLRFLEDQASFHASALIFEYNGKPKACHQPDAILKIDLSGGDSLKQDAYEKVSNVLPTIIPLLGNKVAAANLLKSFDPKGLFGMILTAFTSDQLADLAVQVEEERKKRG
jgi:hypothetical protein